ncbi:hypothetical protein ASPTUDRAFT_40057 [Aspergillus tubingensis CBS 134.48]|uniref:Uncharacterized protein n=1 Tax=Aspergillus tubingensis (strain CBS 134.48) TaxID=767770 RepID=A0A1L9NCI3_ASPTC|nr:hypothetical protein ASPTUDRAFT_40057 [Aspergillus tubingensis CBS 134.48]
MYFLANSYFPYTPYMRSYRGYDLKMSDIHVIHQASPSPFCNQQHQHNKQQHAALLLYFRNPTLLPFLPKFIFPPGVTQNLGLGNGGGIHETYLSFKPPVSCIPSTQTRPFQPSSLTTDLSVTGVSKFSPFPSSLCYPNGTVISVVRPDWTQ